MPKQVIILEKLPNNSYKYCLWANVPAAQQNAYRDFSKKSSYIQATDTENLSIKSGQVAERIGITSFASNETMANIQTALQNLQILFQTEITNKTDWSDYGRFWDGTSWTAGGTPPMAMCSSDPTLGISSYMILTPVSAFAINKFHLVLHNNSIIPSLFLVKIRLVVFIPQATVVTGILPTDFTLQRREIPTTLPSGGAISSVALDSFDILPSSIVAYNGPTTAPAGGTIRIFHSFAPQSDEIKLSGTDAPTMASIGDFCGVVIYSSDRINGCKPITLRSNQTLEIVQSATAGTGNGRFLVFFTVE